MKRREFIILSSVGAASASLLSACGHPEEKLIPAFIPDEEYVPGIDYWKASTCGMCPAGCGIIVRTREHKANKIEGNPLHPVNRGALCARGQAGLQVLYNPDRIKGPMKRVGERGEGKWKEISWDEAIKTLADKLQETKAAGLGDKVVFATSAEQGLTGLVAEHFLAAYGSKLLVGADVFNQSWNQAAYGSAYGLNPVGLRIPTFDIANARYLLSFGERFLETSDSPVVYSLAYGQFRRGSGRARGKFVQIEPRMSLTGANADEWLPAAIGTEGIVALAIAQVIIREGLVRNVPAAESLLRIDLFGSAIADGLGSNPTPEVIDKYLEGYAPEQTTTLTGIPAEKILRIAREFASSQPAIAFGSGTNQIGSGQHTAANHAVEQVRAIHYLNQLVGNLNRPGGVLLPEAEPTDLLAKWRAKNRTGWLPMTGEVAAGPTISALLMHQVNPVQNEPRIAERIKRLPFVASFSSFMDETTLLADLVLPDHSYLESWDIRASQPFRPGVVVTLTQPVIKPELNTRQAADVLLSVLQEIGQPLPFTSSEELVKQAVSEFAPARASDDDAAAEDSWANAVGHGVWVAEAQVKSGTANKPVSFGPSAGTALAAIRSFELQRVGDEDYPLILLTYEHIALGKGLFANLPSLQELPDPMTSAMWGSWVEINPRTAASLGIADADLVEVRTTEGSVTVPAVLYQAIRPDVIAMPHGQGHEAYGRYASGRGANAAWLNPFALSTQGMTVRAKLIKLDGNADLIRFGTDLQERMEKKPWR
jgi:menaquinone reductase, molybdopterin-binding-like subunit